jgi:WD40 repeat protein
MTRPIPFLILLILVASTALLVGAPAPPIRSKPAISAANATRVKKLRELPHDIWEIVWRPKQRQVCFLGWERPVEVLDADTFKPLEKLASGGRFIHVAASRDGNSIALVPNSNSVEVQHLGTRKKVVLKTGNPQPKPAFSPDGKLVATGGYGTQAKLWDATSGRLIRSFDAAGVAGGLTVAFSPNGKLLALGNRNDDTNVYEVATGKLLYTLTQKMTHELKFSPDGRTLAVAYVNGEVGLWNMVNGKLLCIRKTGASEIYTLDWSLRGDVLATAGREGKILLLSARDLKVLKELEAPQWVIRVRFSPDGSRLLSAGGGSSAGSDRKVVVWGLDP